MIMSDTLLSILIPTVVGREKQFNALMQRLHKWRAEVSVYPTITIHWAVDNKEMTIGEKRNWLYQEADGLYSLQIDDDDDLAPGALGKILEAIKEGPDCVTYLEYCKMNGSTFLANHELRYQDWADNFDGYDFVRTPYFKDVIRTEIAKSVPVPNIRYSEDHEWSRALKPHLKTEVHLDQIIYLYQHESKPNEHNQRYGIK